MIVGVIISCFLFFFPLLLPTALFFDTSHLSPRACNFPRVQWEKESSSVEMEYMKGISLDRF